MREGERKGLEAKDEERARMVFCDGSLGVGNI